MKLKPVTQILLLLSTLSSGIADGGKYPPFSWDRVPLYAHFGISQGLTPEKYDFLAEKFDFIALTAGRLPRDDKGSAETYTAEAARAIKQRNPQAKVLFYWASDKPKHQSKLSNAAYPGDYLIHTQRRKGKKDEITKFFDLTRKEVQDWWSDAAGRAVHQYSCDGIFIDGATAGSERGAFTRAFGEKTGAEIDAAMFAMLKDARKKMGPDKLMIFNPLHGSDAKHEQIGQEYLPVTDGAMIDDFDRGGTGHPQSKEYMLSTIEAMQQAAKDGKVVVFKGWPRFTMERRKSAAVKKSMTRDILRREAQKDLTFPLACFLLGTGKNCFFCYTWGWNPEEGSFEWYPEFDKPLGTPKSSFTREGWVLRREFEHASVFVDLEKRTAKINWKRNVPGK